METVKQETGNRKNRLFFLLPFAFCLLTFLTGCVRYDVGVNFEGQHRGAIIQQIKLGEQLTSFSQSEAEKWLRSIERRARKLQGKTQRVSTQEIVVTIPFSNGEELESKFNQFFNPSPQQASQSAKADAIDLVQLDSQMRLNQNNFLLVQRNHLRLSLDLRALGVLSTEDNVLVSPGSLLDLKFSLKTPWGARSQKKAENAITPAISPKGRLLVWQLKPGQVNDIEAVFWLPSPLGIGTIVIALLILGGFYIKYKRFPWTTEPTASPAVPEG